MMSYRLATREDNAQLLALSAASGMKGDTGLRIDRNPDFFKLLEMRGDTKVFVALNEDTIVGCLCVSFQQVYVDGKILPIAYIGDFKVAQPFRNKGIGLRLSMNLEEYLLSIEADLAFLNLSKGNTKPISFFKNRRHLPDFVNIGTFNVCQFIGSRKEPSHSEFQVESAIPTQEILKFFNDCHKNYQTGSVITQETLKGSTIFIVRHHHKVIAAMCLSDTMHAKQNVVTKLSPKMKFLISTLNTLSGILGISKMPSINKPVRMLYIRYLTVGIIRKDLVKLLVEYARHIAYKKGYSFASLGIHEKDPLNSCVKGLPKFTFNSVGMVLTMRHNHDLVNKIKDGIPFTDFSLV